MSAVTRFHCWTLEKKKKPIKYTKTKVLSTNKGTEICITKIVENKKKSKMIRDGKKYISKEFKQDNMKELFTIELNLFKTHINKMDDDCVVRCVATDNNKILIIEYGGESLNKIKTDDLNELQKRDIILKIIIAFENLATYGVLHMDLAPRNILLDEHGTVRMCDFGVAVHTGKLTKSFKKLKSARLKDKYFEGKESQHSLNQDSIDEWAAPEILFQDKVDVQIYVDAVGKLICYMYGHSPKQVLIPPNKEMFLNLLKSNSKEESKEKDKTMDGVLKFKNVYSSQFWQSQSRFRNYPETMPETLIDLVDDCLATIPSHRIALKKIKTHPYFYKKQYDQQQYDEKEKKEEKKDEKENESNIELLKPDKTDHIVLHFIKSIFRHDELLLRSIQNIMVNKIKKKKWKEKELAGLLQCSATIVDKWLKDNKDDKKSKYK
eukprot:105326_1